MGDRLDKSKEAINIVKFDNMYNTLIAEEHKKSRLARKRRNSSASEFVSKASYTFAEETWPEHNSSFSPKLNDDVEGDIVEVKKEVKVDKNSHTVKTQETSQSDPEIALLSEAEDCEVVTVDFKKKMGDCEEIAEDCEKEAEIYENKVDDFEKKGDVCEVKVDGCEEDGEDSEEDGDDYVENADDCVENMDDCEEGEEEDLEGSEEDGEGCEEGGEDLLKDGGGCEENADDCEEEMEDFEEEIEDFEEDSDEMEDCVEIEDYRKNLEVCENKSVIPLVPIIQSVRGTRFKNISGTEDVILIDCDENEGIEKEDFSEELHHYEAIKHDMETMLYSLIEEGSTIDSITHDTVCERLANIYREVNFSPESAIFKQVFKKVAGGIDPKEASRRHFLNQMAVPGVRNSDMETLDGENWLNDVIVNKYLSMLVKKEKQWVAISSFFCEELERNSRTKLQASAQSKGTSTPSRRLPKCKLPENWASGSTHILVPACVDKHWILMHVDLTKFNVILYNSMPHSDHDVETLRNVTEYMQQIYHAKTGRDEQWTMKEQERLQHQLNNFDCGVYVCMFARMLVCSLGMEIDHSLVTEFRSWIRSEISEGSLLL